MRVARYCGHTTTSHGSGAGNPPHPMTASSARPPLAAASPTAAVGVLRAHGMRVSSARRLVLEALYAADGPVSAEAITGGLDGRLTVSDLASVYRNLETLEHVGLVEHVHLGHGPGLYAIAGRHGGWAACDGCGRRAPVDAAALERIRDVVLDATGFYARFSHFPIVGLCPDCIDGGGDHAHP
jgi:Fur family ferric uptake transcriptional regulator